MAVIGRRSLLAWASALLLNGAEAPDEGLRVINRLTTALSGGDAEGAIGAFDKSCPGYDTLSDYFATLTSSFEITNEADVQDERTSSDTVTLTLDWTLTLRSLGSAATSRKEQQVTVDVARKIPRITRFSPIEFFRPA